PGVAHERSERAKDLSRDAELRRHRRRQRQRHVHHGHVRHALEQRHSEPRVRAHHGERFEVIDLGWNPPAGAPALTSISANPNQVGGGNGSTGTVELTSAAPAGGALVALSSGSSTVSVPANISTP